MPDNVNFLSFINRKYGKYKTEKITKDRKNPCIRKRSEFNPMLHQQLLRAFMTDSPYRGLLLYHGLGVGKTCAAIAIAEGFKSNRTINILLNKSLKQNFKINLLRCGAYLMRINQHWEFKSLETKDGVDNNGNGKIDELERAVNFIK